MDRHRHLKQQTVTMTELLILILKKKPQKNNIGLF